MMCSYGIDNDVRADCAQHPLSRKKCQQIRETYAANGDNVSVTARMPGVSRTTVERDLSDVRERQRNGDPRLDLDHNAAAPTPFGAPESPPSLNRITGAVALASVLHPDKMPPDEAYLADLQQSFFGLIPAGQKFAPLTKE
jgi:hypothetical protein